AVGQDDVLGGGAQTAARDPSGAGFAIFLPSGARTIVQQRGEAVRLREPRQRGGQRWRLIADDRVVEAEIDEIGALRLRPHEAQDATACRLAYKGAAPDLAADEPAALGLGIGAA